MIKNRQRLAIRNHRAEAALFKRRAIFCFAFALSFLLVLLANLYNIQIVNHETYQTRSNDNRIRLISVAPNRGLIYDRNGIVIAENRPAFTLEMTPERVPEIENTLIQLQQLFDLTDDDLSQFRRRLRGHPRFKPLTLISSLDEQQVAQFSVNQYRFPGVSVEAGISRYYQHAGSLTHLLGYVARINSKDVNRLTEAGEQSRYAATRNIGKQGIERFYESQLHGHPGSREVEVNNRGRIVRTLNSIEPTAGVNLHLSVDINLQQYIEKILDGRRGAVVALDPNNGEILAMVSSPSYDPNLFVSGISSTDYQHLLNNNDRPLINRATQGQYAPASTIKPHLALVGLEEGKITPATKVWDPGWWQIPGVERRYRDWRRWGHGWVDLNTAIASSCDVYFYDMAYNVGINTISQYMSQFGFGSLTGVDLHEESSGNMPTREWKQIRYKEPWYIGDTISVGIGQGYWTATPLQLAVSTSILANSGTHYTPHFLTATSTDSSPVKQEAFNIQQVTLNRPESWELIQDAMYKTAHSKIGSGYRQFDGATYKAAVKTGTGQVFGLAQDAEYDADEIAEHLRDNALFVGYAPYENPSIVLSIVLENAGWGGANAGPLARSIFDFYLDPKSSPENAQHPE